MKESLNTTMTTASTQSTANSFLSPSKIVTNTTPKNKRKQEKRSPFRILSPNEVHINKSRRSRPLSGNRYSSSSSTAFHDQVSLPVSSPSKMDLSLTLSIIESEDNNFDTKKALIEDHGLENRSSEIDLDQNQTSELGEEPSMRNSSVERELNASSSPLGQTLDLFVTSRKRRDMTMTSTDEEDNNTSSLTNAEYHQLAIANNDSKNHDELNDEADQMETCSSPDLDIGSNGYIKLQESTISLDTECIPDLSFQYPKVDLPSTQILKAFYNLSLSTSPKTPNPALALASNESFSHQLLLSWSKSGILSLEEVIIPALGQEEMNSLKKQQSILKRDKKAKVDSSSYTTYDIAPENTILIHIWMIEQCRKLLNRCVLEACDTARTSRLERENSIRSRIKDKRKLEKLERKRIREEQRKAILHAKAVKREKRRREFKKNLPKNKENWREVAKLMTELAKIQKEQKMWKQAKCLLDEREKELKVNENKTAQPIDVNINNEDLNDMPAPSDVEVKNSIKDITLTADRIYNALNDSSAQIDKADRVKKVIYKKYMEDHQFSGYRGIKDPKGLIQALTLGI